MNDPLALWLATDRAGFDSPARVASTRLDDAGRADAGRSAARTGGADRDARRSAVHTAARQAWPEAVAVDLDLEQVWPAANQSQLQDLDLDLGQAAVPTPASLPVQVPSRPAADDLHGVAVFSVSQPLPVALPAPDPVQAADAAEDVVLVDDPLAPEADEPALPAGVEPHAGAAVLRCRGFGAAFGGRVILADLSFAVPAEGITVLLGPGGTGKSTLLRSLARLNLANSRYRDWGRVDYADAPLGAGHAPALVLQQARLLGHSAFDLLAERVRATHDQLSPALLRARVQALLDDHGCGVELGARLDQPIIRLGTAQQRCLSILAEVVGDPALLMLDEPTAGLADDEAEPVLALIERIGRQRPVLMVLHQQQQARRLAQRVLLIAGGRVQADLPAERFFQSPPNEVARQFVRTGSCNVASPDTPPEHLADDVPAPPPLPTAALLALHSAPEYRGPRGFRWVVAGRLGTSPLPGVVVDIDHDLAALKSVGVTMLITLTRRDLPQDRLAAHGLRNLHLPIYDREAPTIPQLRMLAIRITRLIQKGEVLVVHCRAGLGRTGTVVAGWLIHEGLTADAALQRLRSIDREYVQTAAQEQFLHELEASFLLRV